ncbi:hypothetical protein GCM10011588_31000 [Nocardia jinanensis]|uniref:Uncharacterized protein n=1 Tax=Nocardia jinanensis TaxID=382504 RepID=A0A917VST6_9NOCA|nr:hypothetical protein GCM10011588_31000 [Nocardia jinanensis]
MQVLVELFTPSQRQEIRIEPYNLLLLELLTKFDAAVSIGLIFEWESKECAIPRSRSAIQRPGVDCAETLLSTAARLLCRVLSLVGVQPNAAVRRGASAVVF